MIMLQLLLLLLNLCSKFSVVSTVACSVGCDTGCRSSVMLRQKYPPCVSRGSTISSFYSGKPSRAGSSQCWECLVPLQLRPPHPWIATAGPTTAFGHSTRPPPQGATPPSHPIPHHSKLQAETTPVSKFLFRIRHLPCSTLPPSKTRAYDGCGLPSGYIKHLISALHNTV